MISGWTHIWTHTVYLNLVDVRTTLEAEGVTKRKPFKFINILTTSPQFTSIVGDFWETTDHLFISTSAMFRFSKKLKNMKPRLRSLGMEKLWDIPRRTREAHEQLCLKQGETLSNPSTINMNEEAAAYNKWNLLSESKTLADRNNSYFHKTT